MVGRGRRLCKACKKEFNDSSLEWKEMSLIKRFHAFVPLMAKIWIGLYVGLIIAGFMQDGFSLAFVGTAFSLFLFFLLFWLPFGIYRLWTVSKSIARTR